MTKAFLLVAGGLLAWVVRYAVLSQADGGRRQAQVRPGPDLGRLTRNLLAATRRNRVSLQCPLRFCALLICAIFTWSGATAQGQNEGTEIFAFEVEALNEGLSPDDPPLRLDTPRAALEAYLEAIRRDEFQRAAHALNLSAVPVEQQAERGPELAMMLAFVLRRYDLIAWRELPDQPDARVLPGLQQSAGPYTRRSVELGEVELDGRPIPISL